MDLVRRMLAAVFAGDRRVWKGAVLAAVPVALLAGFYCLRPRSYYTGTDSVESYSYVVQAPVRAPVCVPGLELPSGTAALRLRVISLTQNRPALHMTLDTGERTVHTELRPIQVAPSRESLAVFRIPELLRRPSVTQAVICLKADDVVNWGGTPLLAPPARFAPTLAGVPIAARIAVWYLPANGSRRSYLSLAGAILSRASLFRAGVVGPWLYVLILVLVLPAIALLAVRCLALAAARRSPRRLGAWLFAIAALNFASWAMITPPFQAPDEVDHFAYTQSLVERGQAPSRDPGSPLPRWSSSENLALDDMSFFTDHQVGDTRVPWLSLQERSYRTDVGHLRPRTSDGGGNETAATHGPIYYAALAPAYMAASSSPLAQLTLMRLMSALLGALTVLFTFLLAREVAPGRPWLAVVAALLVAYEPMYGFISGTVNNDVGVNAGAAALLFLLMRMVRRGVSLPWGAVTGALLFLLPVIKGTAYSLYPVAALAILIALWRHHRRANVAGWAGFVVGGVAVRELSVNLNGLFRPSQGNTPGVGSTVGAAGGALEHPLGYVGYLWQLLLPRLSFMAPHFESTPLPAFVIFVERGWGAFGWYDVLFPHWLFLVIAAAMVLSVLLGILAARREWAVVRGRAPELAILLLTPIAVVAGFEAAFYTTGARNFIPEFGRYAFPAIAALAVLVGGSLYAFPRRWVPFAGSALLVGMIGLSYAAQLLTLTGFYA